MRKVLLPLMIMLIMLSGCQAKEAETPNACVPSVMHDGKLYYTTGKQIPAEIDESAVIGKITSVVPLSQWPKEDGQANFGAVDDPYAVTSDGFCVLWNNEWTLFEAREGGE